MIRSRLWSVFLAACLCGGAALAQTNGAKTNAPATLQEQINELQKKVDKLNTQVGGFQQQQHVDPINVMYPYWDGGLVLSTTNEAMKLRVGGVIFLDTAYFTADDGLREAMDAQGKTINSGAEFRSARVAFQGKVYRRISYKLDYDFASKSYSLKDAYVGVAGVPVAGELIFGHVARAFGFSGVPSSKNTVFMEVPVAASFQPGRQTGIASENTVLGNRLYYGAQVYMYSDAVGKSVDKDANVNARLCGLPIYNRDGEQLLHLGATYGYRAATDKLNFYGQPAHLGPKLADTGDIKADGANTIVGEIGYAFGPFGIESEYSRVFVDQKYDDPNVEFDSFYVLATYYLTGESRAKQYSHAVAGFDKGLKPLKRFSPTNGTWGAWQVALMYDMLNLSDENIQGGKLYDAVAGINWYWNSSLRWMFNYVYSDLRDAGKMSTFEGRLSFFF